MNLQVQQANRRAIQIWKLDLKNRKVVFIVDQQSQVFVWVSHLEALKTDCGKVRNKSGIIFLGILKVC